MAIESFLTLSFLPVNSVSSTTFPRNRIKQRITVSSTFQRIEDRQLETLPLPDSTMIGCLHTDIRVYCYVKLIMLPPIKWIYHRQLVNFATLVANNPDQLIHLAS